AILGGVCGEAISRAVMYLAGRRDLGPSGRLVDPALVKIALASVVATLPAWAARRVLGGDPGLVAGIAAYGLSWLGLRLVLRSRAAAPGQTASSVRTPPRTYPPLRQDG